MKILPSLFQQASPSRISSLRKSRAIRATFLIADIWTVSATQRAARIGSTGVLWIGWERKCCFWERRRVYHRLSHTVACRVRVCAAVAAERSDAYSRRGWSRFPRALTFPRATRMTRSSAETLYYPPAARRLRNRRRDAIALAKADSAMRSRKVHDRIWSFPTARDGA